MDFFCSMRIIISDLLCFDIENFLTTCELLPLTTEEGWRFTASRCPNQDPGSAPHLYQFPGKLITAFLNITEGALIK